MRAILRSIIQVLAIALLILFGVGNVMLYQLLVDSQQQNKAEMKTIDAEWTRTTQASDEAQALVDRVAECERRLSRLEAEEDLIRGEQAAGQLEDADLYEDMRSMRKENERIRRIIYLDEKARIAEESAEQIHDILKGDAAQGK